MKGEVTIKMLVLVFLVCYSEPMWAQSEKLADKNYKKEPHWIKMMNDNQVNYFEATKAFEEFWEKRHTPTEEEEWERFGIKKRKSWIEGIFRSEERNEKESQAYQVEYRQFKMWQQSVQAYIKPDGTLLSVDERLQLWKKLRDQPATPNH